MTLLILSFIIAYFYAFNVGASGSAATMGIAYGAQVINKKWIALLLSGIGCLAGAFWGGEVVETIGKGLLSESSLTVEAAAIILFVSAITLFVTNLLGIPLSSSEVTVGAIVGVSISMQQLFVGKLFDIVLFWIFVPLTAFLLTFFFGLLKERVKPKKFMSKKLTAVLSVLLIITGFLEAIAAGMNNVASAIGPLVGADVLNKNTGLITGGLFMALGALLLGGRVLETNGKRISHLSLSDGVVISGTSGFLVIGASLLGIPIPMTQVTTSGIVGVGAVKDWQGIWKKKVIHQIAKVWVTSPLISLVFAYCLTEIFLMAKVSTVLIIASGIFATLVLTNFGRTSIIKKARHPLKEEF
ncbi:inorganic phosphate transporter [Halobacillus sp. A5]|uniref:inorganic phosphate transporter n=1 Tax=Halobacillus sp. A5 TaxID=2880263 RepID=UPI0020A67959|nr:inorganic phosphate transporter [Halobacillus sp. A5]MCP3028327.1 inorganic phosphate transporter family protein [Halobacillus sp. A5]